MIKNQKNDVITNNNMMEPVMQFEAGHIYTNDGSVVPIDPRITSTFDKISHCLMKSVMETKKPDLNPTEVQAYNGTMTKLLDNRVCNCIYTHMIAFDSRVSYLINRVSGLLINVTTPDKLKSMVDALHREINDCGSIYNYRNMIYHDLMMLVETLYNPNNKKTDCETKLNALFTNCNANLDRVAILINNAIWKTLLIPIMAELDPEIITHIMDAYSSLFGVFMQDMIYEQHILIKNLAYMDMEYYDMIDTGRDIDKFEF